MRVVSSLLIITFFGCAPRFSSLPPDERPSQYRISWEKDGALDNAIITEIDKKDYFAVDQLADIAHAQMRWQAVTEQVCLSRNQSSVCFNWGQRNDAKLIENMAYVPAKYVLSQEFQAFTGTKITWNASQNKFEERSPITLTLPPVQKMRDRHRLEFDVKNEASYRLVEQSDKRIWLRFIRARTTGSETFEGDTVIPEIRVVQRRKNADIFISIGKNARSNRLSYNPQTHKLVVDVFSTVEEDKLTPAGSVVSGAAVPLSARKNIKPATDKRIWTIVIDAGHGGHDTGAIGIRGTYEKDVNIKMARALAVELKKQKNFRVILTRDDDEFVTLSDRTEIANSAQADFFVSIHCNSSLSPKSSGTELYVLSPDATDEAAAAVARLENSVVALESKKGAKPDKLNELLASMAVNNYLNESMECAALLAKTIKAQTKEANFYVLRGAQMPSLLIELDYLSNPVAELKLRSSRFRSQMAKSIAMGISDIGKRLAKKKEAVASRSVETVGVR